MKNRYTIISFLMLLGIVTAQAQISIGGNVYGGGNAGDTGGSTTVVVRAGDFDGSVFGGARQANVGGSSFVHIDGEHMSGDILINYVYGGNDIAGTIGASATLPDELTEVIDNEITADTGDAQGKNKENTKSYNAFVLTTKERTETTGTGESATTTQPYKMYFGQLFGGGNGDYTYTTETSTTGEGDEAVTTTTYVAKNALGETIARSKDNFIQPELGKTYIEMRGGSCVLLYGGGNNVTVTEATDICIDNPSAITYDITDANGNTKLTNERLKRMGIIELGSAGENVATSDAYQFSRVFGGNNKASMNIRPRWHLKKGMIRNLYSGGNRGAMTYEKGIFLAIKSDDIEVNNVYGGCRMADVNPGKPILAERIEGVLCPPGYAARVSIYGGKINNVYGGNDVSGTVYGGNAVGIHSNVIGNVYGGGNGSYPYTDNKALEHSDLYSDFYYNVNGTTSFTGMQSVKALNEYRPHAEAVSVRLLGKEGKPTFIGGSVYCGGNSATLHSASGEARAQLKIGSYVYADNVFLGSNGENMVTNDILERLAKNVKADGTITTSSSDYDFSQMDLTDADQFAEYMKGCEMTIKPEVVFDNHITSGTDEDYVPYTAYFGSFYCGGNRGSVNTTGMSTIDFIYPVVIYDKLVGGSNNAVVLAGDYNARYEGGIIGDPAPAEEGKIGDKLTLNLSGLAIEPKRWRDVNNKSQASDLIWNTVDKYGNIVNPEDIPAVPADGKAVAADLERRLVGGNIYGGCCTSGVVNGNVIINVNATLMDRDKLFDDVDAAGEGLYGDDVLNQDTRQYTINERRSGVILDEQGMDVLGSALCLFGGGKGRETEIWGSTTVNLNKGFVFQVFGGSEEGIIGKAVDSGGTYTFKGKSFKQNDNYSCTINLRSPSDAEAEAEFIYGGGFLGPVCGNTILNLGKGKVFNTFAGACNADILGHTETYMGRQIKDDGTEGEGFPYIEDYIYGGNDLGGSILGKADFTGRVRDAVKSKIHSADAPKNVSAYMEYQQGHALGIFGGCYGTYDYTDPEYKDFFYTTGSDGQTSANLGTARPGYTKPRMDKAFVNFRPSNDDKLKVKAENTIGEIYGAGQGQPGDADRDIMQQSSYILIDIPQDMTNFDKDHGNLQVWGAGAWSGLGMREYVEPGTIGTAADAASAIIDLPRGQLNAVYGGSYKEGFTRRTVVNVPTGSTVSLNKIFGGAYGVSNNDICDVYEGHVNWNSENALVSGLYGGNNNARRTLYGRVNVNAPVWTNKTTGYMATVYGAGFGENTWSQYTEVNLNKGSQVYMVYGGGHNGRVANVATTTRMSEEEFGDTELAGLKIADPYANGKAYAENGLNNPLAKARHDGKKYNTNVIINKGAIVGSYALGSTPGFVVTGGYAYGGGMGSPDKSRSGDVNGTTYIALLGGTVEKDLVAAGSVGSVFDRYGGLTDDFGKYFVASATAYIGGGVVRNVFGGGYMGSVGKHKTTGQLKDSNGDPVTDKDGNPVIGEIDADISASTQNDISAEAYVIIGIRDDQTEVNKAAALSYATRESTDNDGSYGFYNGIPAVQRNVYGGGEGEDKAGGRGGAVFGRTNVILNNGRIGYDWINGEFIEKLNDETWMESDSIGRLKDYGNVFGGGYSDKSNVDETNVVMYGGILRGSMHGGAELAAIGRGSTRESGVANHKRDFQAIYKAGKTHVEMYNGHVKRNVFGGGKGYNVLGFGGKNDLYTDGYVFGQTEVYIHGGEIGTEEGLSSNNGNVFGGGDVGYVYSKGYTNPNSRTTGTGSPNHYYYYYNDGTGDNLTEDCKVVISPYLQVKPGQSITYDEKTYNAYEYVPTEYLNTLPKKNATTKKFDGEWLKLFTGVNSGVVGATEDTDERGIHIRNAVFAGGNVSSNNDKTYANATTVFGNTTATLFDVYHRDFITVGTEHIGGLYGGGNLSVVDGYRELNITNYGTDYYGLDSQITLDEYKGLSNRERAYFQLQYICSVDEATFGDITYRKDQVLKEDEYLKLLEKYPGAKTAFTPYGFCSIYAGRLLNTIQRADFCGVFGSRMVLQGAKDRVADVGEDIDYTINRVGEVSLNQQRSELTADEGTDDALHGNYFGIYSVVNYMGNLTSDVHFGDPYRPSKDETDNTQSYYSYKKAQPTSSKRNHGASHNQVALASGVFLELTTENSTADHKDYGYVTGVIELDLINVKRDEVGGGFVYAKNEHRIPRRYPNKKNVILSKYNNLSGNEAITYKQFRYYSAQEGPWPEEDAENVGGESDEDLYKYVVYETSGNFIHPSKRIVDDCYPINNAYIEGRTPYSEAHYWYVKGDVYIYDQKLSAYTGSASAYSKEVHLPLTITAASHGRLQLLNVKPNLYAYYMPTEATGVDKVKIGSEEDPVTHEPIDKVWVNNESDSYELNDVITWWDWHQLSATEQTYFVTQTYVNCITCTIDGIEYEAGTYVMDDKDFTTFKGTDHTIINAAGDATTVDFVFRSSNNIGHDTGYVLTLDMNSPKVWDDYYTAKENGETTSSTTTTISKLAYGELSSSEQYDYYEGPTFRPIATDVYGQRQYEEGAVITEEAYNNSTNGTATMEKAYVAFRTVTYTYNGQQKIANPGTPIPKSEYDDIGATAQASFGEALICTSTVKLSSENYMLYGELKTQAEIEQMVTDFADIYDDDGNVTGHDDALEDEIRASMTPAYICSSAGGWGGQRLENTKNYDAITAWCSLSKDDRIDENGNDKFTFNYDGLDLINDAEYLALRGVESPSHERTVEAFHSPYTDLVPVEYSAVFNKDEEKIVEFTDGRAPRTFSPTDTDADKRITNEEFEVVRNDQRHYTRVSVASNGETIYIAKDNFVYNGIPYGKGQVVEESVATLPVNQDKVDGVWFENTSGAAIIRYYRYENYVGDTHDQVIDESTYVNLPNHQRYFVIQGQEPTETTTLYVSRESDIYDLTKKKVITVVYQYTYYEDEDDGSVKLTNELHVVNIHLELESGVPQIGQLDPPSIVLPGDAVGLRAPEVKPGLYEILTNGWTLFDNYDDAVKHQNGTTFVNNSTPVYWYQNQKAYVAFYSKTYMGYTYSNPVPVSVANYHDLDNVMQDKEHHMFVDHPNVERDSKIYIDNRDCKSDATKSELDLLKDFFDLSVLTTTPAAGSTLEGHALLNSRVSGGNNLEFFLRSNVSPKAYTTWNPIGGGASDPCFSGTLHGDGYTVSGLSSSLFGKLCGNVYNLGVTGSFTGAGVAETGDGYVENCWITTSATTGFAADTNPVFGQPTRNASDERGSIQVENCYYPESNPYLTKDYGRGMARQMPDKDFYNGEVAYNLNGFYLKKRYYDQVVPTGSDVAEYRFLKSESNTTLPTNMSTAKYPAAYAVYQPGVKMPEGEQKPWLGYVENRFYDGDFRYANGEIPTTVDIRMRTVTTGEGDEAVTTTYFTPIWPDDYIFFGQALTYGHVGNREHQPTPSRINKSQERILTTADGNRVYRAPAYFRSKKVDVAHFNPYAIFAQTKKDEPTVIAYKDMTAIDFSGGNSSDVHNQYQYGWNNNSQHFFYPLLDDDGLTLFQNMDLTRNLLVYTGAPGGTGEGETPTASQKTANVVSTYLHDEPYEETNATYHTVAPWNSESDAVRGHWVQKVGEGNYVASLDHLLVDRYDFNAPIAYTFADGKRMWYQRKPDNYVGVKKIDGTYTDNHSGWNGISLPFKADIVTTNVKGEITHFYSGSATSANSDSKVGHEYWLRELSTGGKVSTSDADVFEAVFSYPDAKSADGDKEYTNTFLWDYYYSWNNRDDLNKDDYHTYYKADDNGIVHTFESYPRLAAATPYIIGFPGERYYEFDLSGKFEAKTTDTPNPTQLGLQTITFASVTGASIGVSDDETNSKTDGGYTFMPTYMNNPTIGANTNVFLLDSDGDSFNKTASNAVNITAFRPYFTAVANGARQTRAVGQIVFGLPDSKFGAEEHGDPAKGEANESLEIYAKKHKIAVVSALSNATDVRIVNAAGQTIASFEIQPGETIETRIYNAGIYIVQSADGKYIKKLAVK